jgi:hypothetical protein
MKKLLLSLLLAAGCGALPARHVLDTSTLTRVEALMPQLDVATFQRAVVALAQECPLDAPAHVTVKVIEGPYLGLTYFDPTSGMYEIQLEGRVAEFTLYDTLAHEWAHARTWRMVRAGDPHDEAWGVELSHAYLTMLRARFSRPDPALFLNSPPVGPDDDCR